MKVGGGHEPLGSIGQALTCLQNDPKCYQKNNHFSEFITASIQLRVAQN